ncbi:hypothetical protein BGX38DRAFT_275059 [Terfezia claveryi]|nr:hypothetical protein BGX38DRAFT_275059 [Terfezia claveryi]
MAPGRRISTAPATTTVKKPTTTTAAASAAALTKKKSRRSFTAGGVSTSAVHDPAGKRKGKTATTTPVSKGKGAVASGRVEKQKHSASRRSSGATSTSATNGGVQGRGRPKGKGKNNPQPDDGEEEEEEEGESMDVDSDNSDHDLQPVLLPYKLRVPLHTVDTKWAHLPSSSQSLIATFLTNIETSVLSTFTSERRRLEAHSTLCNIKRKLVSQLPKIPIPAIPLKDLGLDLQKLHEMNRGIEAQVRPEIVQISTLDREISELRRKLEVKRRQLSELKGNERKEEVLRRERGGRVIWVLRRPLTEVEEKFRGDNVRVGNMVKANGDGGGGSTYDPSNDPEVVELKRRLGTHLGSIAANVRPFEGFEERICGVRAVVEEVLGRMGGDVVNGVMEV